ncbi:MAG: division/cell wall cluster transcriptional repressor MraZ [Terracidiphilus sp.]
MFRGNYAAKVDDRGRLKIPSAFKDLLDAAKVNRFFVTSIDGSKAEVWPLHKWEEREQALSRSSTLNSAVEKYITLTNYYGQEVEMDTQGRMVLPPKLRNKADLNAEVAVSGATTHLVVQNWEAYEASVLVSQMSADELKALDQLFKSGI